MIKKKITALFLAAFVMITFAFPQAFAAMTSPTAPPAANITGNEVTDSAGNLITVITKGSTFSVKIFTDIVSAGMTATASIGSCKFTANPNIGTPDDSGGSFAFTFSNVKYNDGDTSLKVKVNVKDSNGKIITHNLTTLIAEAVDTSNVSTVTTTPAPPAGNPTFELYSSGSTIMNAGSSGIISLYIQNISDSTAVGLTATATATDAKSGITFPSGNIYRTSYEIEEWERRSISFNVSVAATTPEGSYPIDIKIATTNADGTASTTTIQVFVDVKSSVRAAALDVTEYSIDKKIVKKGDAFTLTVKLKNNCGIDLTDVKLGVDKLDGTKFAMNGGLAFVSAKIPKGGVYTMKIGLVACDGITSIREVLEFIATYRLVPSDKESEQKITTPMTIPCEKPPEKVEASDVLAPNIIITKYDFGAEYVVGGVIFPLSLSFQNASTISSIQNLKVVVEGVPGTGTDTGIAFSPANSSNSFFFPSLAAGGSTEIKLDMLPRADAKPTSYPLQITFNYEYMAGGKSKKAEAITEKIVIPLQQEDRFVANPMELGQQTAYVGQEFGLNATFVNKGKSAVYNVTVDVDGTGFDKTSTAYYIGNVESGKEEYYDTRVIPTAEGEMKGDVVVSYEDANGKPKELRVPFLVTAMSMEGNMGGMNPSISIGGEGSVVLGPDGMPVDGGAAKGLPLWAKIVIPAGGVLILGAGTVVFFKIKKKKKLAKIEKEDSDENI